MTRIILDAAGDSQVFTTTRDVRNSEHPETLPEGYFVIFRRTQDSDRLHLAYAGSGEPTSATYVEFASVAEAEAFADRVGLVARG